MKNEVLYLGPFNPEDIVRQRKLPFRNPAAFNRMLRVAKAFQSTGTNIRIVSTGVSMNVGFSKQVVHGAVDTQYEAIPLSVLPAMGVPVLGFLLEPLLLSVWLLARLVRNRPAALVVYNSTIASAAALFLARLFFLSAIYEVEDVPTWDAVANHKSIFRIVQEISWIVAAKLQLVFCTRLFVPSERFLSALQISAAQAKQALVVTGCMDVTAEQPVLWNYAATPRPLRVLFAGKLEVEHGYDLALGAISEILKDETLAGRFEFHICGRSGNDEMQGVLPPDHPMVKHHGFVSDDDYRTILADVDIGLALQRSSGLFKNTKTPSKAYEFLASGKLVIATDIGDLQSLFPHAAICLRTETAEQLAALLKEVAANPRNFLGIADEGLKLAKQTFSYEAIGSNLLTLLDQTV